MDLASNFDEYLSIIQDRPILSDEDILFIEKFINDCLNKRIDLQRDENGNLELLLEDKQFLNTPRTELLLSNGEQNFISLAFELLKAKNVDSPIIVLDDPISSFDSIYKNKIAYAIIKFLTGKQKIILTHNTDLIRLLEHQFKDCFNLFLLNNTEGETNGFIRISKDEQKLLLYLHKLINFFRETVKQEIVDERCFLISVIPFMRGYAQITNEIGLKNKLTNLMHGYNTDVENLTEIYRDVFKTEIITTEYRVSAEEISNMRVDGLEILSNEHYPLLNKTLIHTLTYLYLRLNVEKKLVQTYSVNTNRHQMLNAIINQSFGNSEQEDIERRVFLLSRKTLLNEFNHFEVNMNIFQPAIDITDVALRKEKDDILSFLDELE